MFLFFWKVFLFHMYIWQLWGFEEFQIFQYIYRLLELFSDILAILVIILIRLDNLLNIIAFLIFDSVNHSLNNLIIIIIFQLFFWIRSVNFGHFLFLTDQFILNGFFQNQRAVIFFLFLIVILWANIELLILKEQIVNKGRVLANEHIILKGLFVHKVVLDEGELMKYLFFLQRGFQMRILEFFNWGLFLDTGLLLNNGVLNDVLSIAHHLIQFQLWQAFFKLTKGRFLVVKWLVYFADSEFLK